MMGIGRKAREEKLEKEHQEFLDRKLHSDLPEWMREYCNDKPAIYTEPSKTRVGWAYVLPWIIGLLIAIIITLWIW